MEPTQIMKEFYDPLVSLIADISDIKTAWIIFIAIFLSGIMSYIKECSDLGVDSIREKHFGNKVSRRTIYHLFWLAFFCAGYALSPYQAFLSNLLFATFFAICLGYGTLAIAALVTTFFVAILYDIPAATFAFYYHHYGRHGTDKKSTEDTQDENQIH